MNYGEAQGGANFLGTILQTYMGERNRRDEAKQKDLAMALQAKTSGLQLDPMGSSYSYTPEKQKEIEQGYLKTQAEIGKLNRGVGDEDLDRQVKLAQIGKLKEETKNAGHPKERLAPAGEVSSLGESKAALGQLDDLMTTIGDNASMVGPGAGLLSRAQGAIGVGEGGKSARVIESQLNTAAQEIGRYLEGGKLTDQDIIRYKRDVLPTQYDDPDTFKRKAENLQRRIAEKARTKAESLSEAGYDLGTYKPSVSKSLTPTSGAERKAPIKTVGAKTYRKVNGGWEEISPSNIGSR